MGAIHTHRPRIIQVASVVSRFAVSMIHDAVEREHVSKHSMIGSDTTDERAEIGPVVGDGFIIIPTTQFALLIALTAANEGVEIQAVSRMRDVSVFGLFLFISLLIGDIRRRSMVTTISISRATFRLPNCVALHGSAALRGMH